MKKEKEKKKKRAKRPAVPETSTSVPQAPAGPPVEQDLPDAPLSYFLRTAGGKWKCRILWALRDGKGLRYSELKHAVSGVTDMMLSQSLKELYTDKMVSRKQYQEIPPKVEYRLTDKGAALLPALTAVCEWEGAYAVKEQVP